ncbi:hypothetical protein BC938DRAFT_472003 [Jimgerdemannia flammicorona]|uniref:ATP-dependent DNA helicase n=1 Tax=Jimgerdemannia flammicorona TaxID=994334 RepID=A0A433QZY2_9FUNG|nr:hypothetical protein BC938DRAFT_472003 [Jimgerdemannia flammicorona]
MIALLAEKHDEENIAITVTTGIAASHINGQMIHSFTEISNGAKSVEELISSIMKNATVQDQWKTAVVLIIDEISILSHKLFQKLEKIV